MAREQIVLFKDDMDGSEKDVRTVTFAFENTSYEIDLGPKNQARLKKALGPFIDAGTKITTRGRSTGRAATARRSSSADQKEFNARVREWAAANGHGVKPRGRIPEPVLDAYYKAGNK